MIAQLATEEMSYYSSDTINDDTGNRATLEALYPTEFLNTTDQRFARPPPSAKNRGSNNATTQSQPIKRTLQWNKAYSNSADSTCDRRGDNHGEG